MNLCGDCQYLKDNNCEYDQPVCVNLFGRFFTPTEDKRPFLSDEVSKEEIELINKSELIEFDFMLINSPIVVIRKNGYLNVGTPKTRIFNSIEEMNESFKGKFVYVYSCDFHLKIKTEGKKINAGIVIRYLPDIKGV